MSTVIITGQEAEHRYVANAISRANDVAAILVCKPPQRRSPATVLRRSPIRFLDKTLRTLFLKAIFDDKRKHESIDRVLGVNSRRFCDESIVRSAGSPKSDEFLNTVKELKPDVLAIYGTSIIPDSVLQVAGTIALNMHTGLSPEYRGVACYYWPLIDGRPDMVGATVHECTSSIDGGRVFFRRNATLYQGDDLHAVFARAVAVGSEGYPDVVDAALRGRLEGKQQDPSTGKEFRGAMLGVRTEIAARLALKRISRDLPIPPPDVEES